jgi:hypothetical protein
VAPALLLPHEILYLTRDPEGAGPVTVSAPRLTLAAVVAELNLQGRITIDRKRAVVIDPTPVGSAVVDSVLDTLREKDSPVKIGSLVLSADWTRHAEARPDRIVLDELVHAAVLRSDPHGVFHRDRFVPLSPGWRESLLSQVTIPLAGGPSPDPRQVERIGILALFRLLGRVIGTTMSADQRRRAKKIMQDAPAAGQLQAALAEIEVV